MEKKVKKLYNLSCNWYMSNLDEQNASLPMYISKEWETNRDGDVNGSFSGKFVLFDDDSLVGYATEKSKPKINQLLTGVFVEGKGVSICKIYADDLILRPTYYHVFANNTGLNDSYYGEFFSTNRVYDSKKLGETSVKATKKIRDEFEISEVIDTYNRLREQIKSNEFIGNSALCIIEGVNSKETANLITEYADMVYNEKLSDNLQQEILESQQSKQ